MRTGLSTCQPVLSLSKHKIIIITTDRGPVQVVHARLTQKLASRVQILSFPGQCQLLSEAESDSCAPFLPASSDPSEALVLANLALGSQPRYIEVGWRQEVIRVMIGRTIDCSTICITSFPSAAGLLHVVMFRVVRDRMHNYPSESDIRTNQHVRPARIPRRQAHLVSEIPFSYNWRHAALL